MHDTPTGCCTCQHAQSSWEMYFHHAALWQTHVSMLRSSNICTLSDCIMQHAQLAVKDNSQQLCTKECSRKKQCIKRRTVAASYLSNNRSRGRGGRCDCSASCRRGQEGMSPGHDRCVANISRLRGGSLSSSGSRSRSRSWCRDESR